MAEIQMEEQIKLLIEAQGLDGEIFKLEKELAAKPEEIKRLEEAFKRTEEETKAADADLKQLQLDNKKKEMDLKTKEDAGKKLEEQLYQIKTNKEYTAMQTEIKGAKADCSLLEEEILILFEKIEEAEKRKAERTEYLKVEKGKLENEKKRIAEEAKKVETELKGLKEQRAQLVAKVDKTILSKYERILHNKDGMALVPIKNNACQGCFLDMPPQVVNEIKMKKDLVFCESCARILYLDD